MFDIKLDLSEWKKLLDPSAHKRAMSRALNEAARWARKEWIQKIREKYAIRSTYLRERVFSIRHSTPERLRAVVIVQDKKQYPVAMAYPARQTKEGVQTEFLRGKRFVIPSGFLWSGKAWRRKRIGDRLVPRKPIILLKGPGTPVIARSKEITDRILQTAIQKVITRYEALIRQRRAS